MHILALLDYVSRAQEIKSRPSSIRSSVVRLWHRLQMYLWTYCMDFFQILVLAFPGPYVQMFLEILKKKMILGFFYESKKCQNTTPSNYFRIFSILFWNFFSVVHTEVLFWTFEILSLRFSQFFISFSLIWDLMGAKISKRYSSLKLLKFESFQTLSEISSQLSTQKYCFGFLKIWVYDFSRFLFVFVSMGPCGRQNLDWWPFLKFLLSCPHKFLKFTIIPYGEIKTLN